MADNVSGGSIVAKSLRTEDVEYVFTISGGHINTINKGLVEEGIKIITTRHDVGSWRKRWLKYFLLIPSTFKISTFVI